MGCLLSSKSGFCIMVLTKMTDFLHLLPVSAPCWDFITLSHSLAVSFSPFLTSLSDQRLWQHSWISSTQMGRNPPSNLLSLYAVALQLQKLAFSAVSTSEATTFLVFKYFQISMSICGQTDETRDNGELVQGSNRKPKCTLFCPCWLDTTSYSDWSCWH